MKRILLTLGLLLGGWPHATSAAPLLSELFYDATGSDDGRSFVELSGAPGFDLAGFMLEGINGSNGSTTGTLTLTGAIPVTGLFVLADRRSDGSTEVSDADLLLNFDFQNGPDSVLLIAPDGSVVDALGYGEFGAGEIFAGEGSAAPDAPADSSLARRFADLDSDDNAFDFVVGAPTPGQASFAVPEPGSAALVSLGVGMLAALGRRRPASPPR